MEKASEYKWKIIKMVTEALDVKSLYLMSQDVKPTFRAGQYLTIKIPGLTPLEGKAYSISSAPHEENVRLTIRKIGKFSTALLALSVGETIMSSSPYGYFYPEPEDKSDLAFVVGGIGITPCLSIIKDLNAQRSSRRIHLLYSNQTEADITFRDELMTLNKNNKQIKLHHFITREQPKTAGFSSGRITPSQIMALVPYPLATEFFLCGSMDFTKSLWKGLRNAGIPQHQLYTEGFF